MVCVKCNQPGHRQIDCPNFNSTAECESTVECSRCFQTPHRANECFALTTTTGVAREEVPPLSNSAAVVFREPLSAQRVLAYQLEHPIALLGIHELRVKELREV